jgi:hypothetical protein
VKLPNGDRAVIDTEKLRSYCLNPEHFEGCNKAKVFAAALGITADNAELLWEALASAARVCDARFQYEDAYGKRFVIDFEMKGLRSVCHVRSAWIVREGEVTPRLVTCYVL